MKNSGMKYTSYKIRYSKHVDLKRVAHIPKRWLDRVEKAISKKLKHNPDVFGKPLRKSLKGCRTLRIEDYRVVYRIENDIVEILTIDHRSVVYKDLEKKIRRMRFPPRFIGKSL